MPTGWGEVGEGKYRTPLPSQANFKTLVNKNANPEIGGPPPPQAIFPKSLGPP